MQSYRDTESFFGIPFFYFMGLLISLKIFLIFISNIIIFTLKFVYSFQSKYAHIFENMQKIVYKKSVGKAPKNNKL